MRALRIRAVVCGMIALAVTAGQARADEPVRVIFDTDFCGDCDDVLALGMLHALQARGACELLAVTVSVDHPQVAPLVNAVNTFYGRGEIPIGVVRPGGVAPESRFAAMVEEQDDGRPRYPHALTTPEDAPEAVDLLRKTLAAQPDGSVTMVQVGFSTNLARLLEAPADDHSPLDGEELVKQKVAVLEIMAGAFEPIDGNPRYLEYNVVQDIESARKLAERWPTPVIWSGFEIGISVPYPSESIERDYGYVAHHPLAEAYIRYIPPPHNRPTWDLTSVLHGVYPDRGYFELSEPGTVTVEDDGFSRFTPDPEGRDRYLILRPEARPRVVEALVQLSSQPPARVEEPAR